MSGSAVIERVAGWASQRRLVSGIAESGRISAGNYAMAVAMSALFSMFPLILAVLAVTGLVLPDPARQSQVYHSIAGIFPASSQSEILSALHGVKHNAGLLGVIALIGLLWAGTNLFASLEFALSKVFDYTQRNIVKQRLMGLLMIAGFGVTVVLIVATNSAVAALGTWGPPAFRFAVVVIIGAAILTACCVVIYRWVPNRRYSVRQMLPGGTLAGIAMEAISLLFPLYVRLAHGFNTYGQQFGLFFLLATWVTLLAQVLLFGAVFNKVGLGSAHTPDLPDHHRSEHEPGGGEEKHETVSGGSAHVVETGHDGTDEGGG